MATDPNRPKQQPKSTDVVPAAAKTPSTIEWELLQRQCRAFVGSGFLPDHITKNCTPDQAMAKALTIAWKGRELGVPPMQAFASITVIGGKPCLGAELMLALIYQRVPGAKVTFLSTTNQEAEIEMQRPGGKPQKFKFTMADANAAQLGGKDVWKKYPAAMLRARVISAAARAVFPDCIMGCYTPEEMGAEVIDVEFVEATESAHQPAPAAPTQQQPRADYKPKSFLSDAQVRRLFAIAGSKNWSDDDVHDLMMKLFKKDSATALVRVEYDGICNHIESNPKPDVGSDEDIRQAAQETSDFEQAPTPGLQ